MAMKVVTSRYVVLALLVVVSICDAGKLTFEGSAPPKVCAGSKSACDAHSTCCDTGNAASTCCPLENAVCCSDGLHCCPGGTTCNVEQASCVPIAANGSLPAVPRRRQQQQQQQPAADDAFSNAAGDPSSPPNMVCPDRSQCPHPGAACCRQYTGRYGCCNYPLNVCCDDGLHCCHSGTVCDQLTLRCIPYPSAATKRPQLPWIQLTEAASAAVAAQAANAAADDVGDAAAAAAAADGSQSIGNAKYVPCPDGSHCPDRNTCCRTYSGYGCCPFFMATCCPDLQHCCQYGYRCTSVGTCVRSSDEIVPWASMNVAGRQ